MVCSKCAVELTPEIKKKGRRMCKACYCAYHREWRKKNPDYDRRLSYAKTYGITLEQYDEMFAAQEGRCAICNRPEFEQKRRLAVDHDHETGEVRELLCDACNVSLGGFQDDPAVLMAAQAYLRRHKRG